MRKIVILSIIALAMLAGIADAGISHSARIYNENANGIAPNPIDILPGQTVFLSYHAEGLASSAVGLSLPYGYEVMSTSNGGSVDDVKISFAHDFAPTDYPVYNDENVIELELDPEAKIGAKYEIKIYTGTSVATCYASASREINSIPEFPTVALPVAAILGLAFITQHRKRE